MAAVGAAVAAAIGATVGGATTKLLACSVMPKNSLVSSLHFISSYQVGKDEPAVTSITSRLFYLNKRQFVPVDKVPWSVDYAEYAPVEYTAPKVLQGPVWADPTVPSPETKWNCVDNRVDRRSHIGVYTLDVNGLPLNPIGRTGISGRGLLGRWGPNHAADPIVTRWKLDSDGQVVRDAKTNQPLLQFVAIQRTDNGQWAIPGGMCDPGERLSTTLKREFMEEALNSNDMNDAERLQFKEKLGRVFSQGAEVYRGYVDDPRNTDNAWMETIAFNFHDAHGLFDSIRLHAGDDAQGVKWCDIDAGLQLYANHKQFIQQVAVRHNAFW